jgi:DNA-3-methyladenine glycosylase
VLEVARDCIGQLLISRIDGKDVIGRIVETEAYRGPEDRAAHSHGGKRTRRTEVMFGEAGHAYVFLLYGIHCAFNVVTGHEGQPHAVLIRALEPVRGLEHMIERRKNLLPSLKPSDGPGKLCRAMGISLRHNGHDLTCGDLYLARGTTLKIQRSTRIGIDYAGAWALKRWRFFAAGNPHVSRFRPPRLES